MSNFSKAVKKPGYWFGNSAYSGSRIRPNTGVIHTTEGTSLPTYGGGTTSPHYTAVPNFRKKTLDWYAHFPDEQSARALRNESGGVETNTMNCVQIELVGTCDAGTSARWKTPHIYWPNAPEWALRGVAEFVADMNRRHKIPIKDPVNSRWVKYPDSYGSSAPQRLTFREWALFSGWCGHQHVPENSHGDPGNINWPAIEKYAKEIVNPEQKKRPLETVASLILNAIAILRQMEKKAGRPTPRVTASRLALRAVYRSLPKPKENKK